jgi:hypothetical protein
LSRRTDLLEEQIKAKADAEEAQRIRQEEKARLEQEERRASRAREEKERLMRRKWQGGHENRSRRR